MPVPFDSSFLSPGTHCMKDDDLFFCMHMSFTNNPLLSFLQGMITYTLINNHSPYYDFANTVTDFKNQVC